VKRLLWIFLTLSTLGCGSTAVVSDGGAAHDGGGGDAGAYCTRHTDCSSCVLDETEPGGACGWCKSKGACTHGTQNGPDDGQCSDGDWAWKPSDCVP
jgi:hypothetical protein